MKKLGIKIADYLVGILLILTLSLLLSASIFATFAFDAEALFLIKATAVSFGCLIFIAVILLICTQFKPNKND